jgi:beta-N-acetylhexosaminidase
VNEGQLKKLCADLKALSTEEPLIFIDQEGGRVNRIAWLAYKAPAGRVIGALYEDNPPLGMRVAYLNAFLLAAHLRPYGINVNCLPVADIAFPYTHDVIGDRAFSHKPEVVARLANATCKGLRAGGCWPIIKHAPGHGRAQADSHKDLPVVDVELAELMARDFFPFKENAACPLIMTAHILYPQLDGKACATQSPKILQGILREKLGMTGLIFSDDLYMEALAGDIPARALASLEAGCELLLVCAGKNDDLEKLAALDLKLSDVAAQKINQLPQLGAPSPHEVEAAMQELQKIWPGQGAANAV